MADHAQGHGAKADSSGQRLKFETSGPSPEQIEAGRKLFASPCEFFYAAQALDHLPAPRGNEIALAGRSNVGKSSLINAITGRKALARVSHQPGRTRQLNFFECQAGPLVLVDMPGYGYAEAPKEIKRDWQGLMLDYLRGRPNLRRVFLLLDARVEVKVSDLTVMELLDQSAVSFQIVLTKADSVKPCPLKRKQDEVLALVAKHPAAMNQIITTSSAAGIGVEELRAAIAEFVE
ncbi:ribosome biogenesis GTP-binding protein YihA/YsxC [Acidocella aminolytica]|jgi:GTP-binding protein|uniref:Probable GTP-binding protein EngB n=1 Tax=Acidocella aminolytica 101 = DSM 11237 TaxID=1120923 RepID=A0A0D6PHK4_9PROT|nr:ribosome biogenesis GTP-binding protein YihA/YsxC [Acidocella aminolytica]GAN80683.1 ribosome biogenesis GTP-binding protein YsxC [Acidocella aminolytica 101 = DSM 11237]GBQ37491.1 ribosome biogenesis GTP-binding protein YsxC [Acidocella aminolytica 101 = DSM 11237]SHE54141.1 GTP-binding protein [Acidocella aminolytica 101 = DSM 11237]